MMRLSSFVTTQQTVRPRACVASRHQVHGVSAPCTDNQLLPFAQRKRSVPNASTSCTLSPQCRQRSALVCRRNLASGISSSKTGLRRQVLAAAASDGAIDSLDGRLLDAEQQAAVRSEAQHVRIIAGPGSGKTLTIAARGASKINSGEPPESILVVTFTNKAAEELRSRLDAVLGPDRARLVTVRTFHSLAHAVLRKCIHKLHGCGLSPNFTLCDEKDCAKMLQKAWETKHPDIPFTMGRLGGVMEAIGALKDSHNTVHGQSGEFLLDKARFERTGMLEFDPLELNPLVPRGMTADELGTVYDTYQAELQAADAMDWNDLLSNFNALLHKAPEVCNHYQSQWHHILVDEFQDTNLPQYEMVRLLAGQHNNLFVVGDVNQAIYGWRGAKREILEDHLQRDYPGITTLRLTNNYRSPPPIIRTAETVLCAEGCPPQHTAGTPVKQAGKEPCVVLHEARVAQAQARVVLGLAQDLRAQGKPLSEMAVLARKHQQLKPIKDLLHKAGIPYHTAGNSSLWKQPEVRKMLALLRLVINTEDAPALSHLLEESNLKLQILKGLGKKTIEALAQAASAQGMSLGSLLLGDCDGSQVPEQPNLGVTPEQEAAPSYALVRFFGWLEIAAPPFEPGLGVILRKWQQHAIDVFRGLINVARAEAEVAERPVHDVLHMLIKNKEVLLQQKGTQVTQNLQLLLQAAESELPYGEDDDWLAEDSLEPCPAGGSGDDCSPEDMPGLHMRPDLSPGLQALQRFVTSAALRQEPGSTATDAIQLMTWHAAKGKEFDRVVMIDCKDGRMRHHRADDLHQHDRTAEERRLFYVAVTRAGHQLVILWTMHGGNDDGVDYIEDILNALLKGVKQVWSRDEGPAWWGWKWAHPRTRDVGRE